MTIKTNAAKIVRFALAVCLSCATGARAFWVDENQNANTKAADFSDSDVLAAVENVKDYDWKIQSVSDYDNYDFLNGDMANLKKSFKVLIEISASRIELATSKDSLGTTFGLIADINFLNYEDDAHLEIAAMARKLQQKMREKGYSGAELEFFRTRKINESSKSINYYVENEVPRNPSGKNIKRLSYHLIILLETENQAFFGDAGWRKSILDACATIKKFYPDMNISQEQLSNLVKDVERLEAKISKAAAKMKKMDEKGQ